MSGSAQAGAGTVAAPQTVTESAAKSIQFEVVSVRKSKAESPDGPGPTADGFDVMGYMPVFLIGQAYQFHDFNRMVGVPGWCVSEKYDIQAKVAEGDVAEWKQGDRSVISSALRGMMEERFQLKAHRETTQGKIYELVVAKGGSKMTQVPPSEAASDVTMDAMAVQLTQRGVSRPVVNNTGLAGVYRARLKLVKEEGAPPGPMSDSDIIYALQEQLGLTLRSAEGPVERLVVDHVERPSEN